MDIEREEEINLLDYWRVIQKRWRIVAGIFGVSVVIAAIVSFLMTPIYRSTVTIMPIESSGSNLSSALQGLQGLSSIPFVGGMVPNIGGTSGQKMKAVLESRTLAEDVIHSLGLENILFKNDPKKPPSLQEVVKVLKGIIRILDDKKGLVSISVEYKDPNRAADIANQFGISLQKFLEKNALSMTKRNRIFIEDQLKKVNEKLKNAEEAMKVFQTDKKIIAVDVQTEAAVKTLAYLNAQATAKEVQLGVMEQFSTQANPDVLRIKDELEQLRKQLSKAESRSAEKETSAFPSLSEAPTLGLQYVRFKREALIQEKVFELLTQQYEMAKIEEAKEDLSFQIIDKAIPPEERIRPKRRTNVMLAGAMSLFAGIFLVFFLEYIANLKESKEQDDKGK